MKGKRKFLPVLPIMLFMVNGFMHEAKGQVEGKWSGTVSLHEKYKGITGWSEKWIDVSFKDNIGSGTIKYQSEFIIEGKSFGKGDCNGTGPVELHIVEIYRYDSTYRIETIGPVCALGSNPWGSGDGNDILIDMPWGGNPNFLSGTKNTVVEMPGGIGTTTSIHTWTLYRGPLDAQLIITPVAYDIWMPKATPYEFRKGSVMDILLNVQGRNGGISSLKAVRFELKLLNTSREPGTTLNMPLSPSSNQLPDIRFLPHAIGESADEDQYIEITCQDGKTGTATLASYDGGGWTTLTAVAVLEGGFRIEGTLLTPTGIKEIPIPKRNPESKIASPWLVQYGNHVDTADHESTAGHSHKGDGLSAYEEYRGVITEGVYKKLNPLVKELGIWGKKEDLDLFGYGITMFKNATMIEPVKFYDLEIGIDRRLNNNGSYANVYKQFALWIHPGNVRELDAQGNLQAFSGKAANGPGIPEKVSEIIIDTGLINSQYRDLSSTFQQVGVRMLYSERDNLGRIVAHETSHGVDVYHHGITDPKTPKEDSVTVDGVPLVTARDINGRILRHGTYILGDIGKPQGLQSGDLGCFMCYTPYYVWALHDNIMTREYYYVPELTVGTKMCRSPAGTSINANAKYFGHAQNGRGNCLGQIKFK